MWCKKLIIIIDVYYDVDGNVLCFVVMGFMYYINFWGDIELCLII